MNFSRFHIRPHRELENAHDGLARWRSTAEAAEKQFVNLKDLYRGEREANGRLSDLETECERLGRENMALQKVAVKLVNRLSIIRVPFAHALCHSRLLRFALHANRN